MIASSAERLRKFFQRRQIAYSRVFDKQNVFTEEVLQDLARFCKIHRTSFHPDARVQALIAGRQEVFLRIMENLKLTTDELYALHNVKNKGDTNE